ncbi:MAG TPA: glycosyltransferase family 2 protein [Candidatus Sulfotelmatobacter sp.]|nr:glycosyltransferase family 2 protein [Candidatus Sulfotelmatobacter sp.]
MSSGTGISYILTVYNKAPHLPLVIEGLRRQVGGFEREFIFVDDGSTDGSAAVIEREARDLPNLIVLRQQNAGPSWAMNAGLARARLPYIKGLDGDDVLTPMASAVLLDAIGTTGCPIAYGSFLRFRPAAVQDPFAPHRSALDRRPPPATRVDRPLERLIDGHFFGNPSHWLAPRSLLLAAGGSDPRIFVQDVSIELRMAARGAFALVDYPVFLSPAAVDGRMSDNQVQTLHDLSLAYANFCAENPDLPLALRRRAARRLTGRAWRWARRRRGKGLLSVDFRRHLQALLALGDPLVLMRESCESFAGPIRTPPTDRAPPVLPTA